MNPSSFIPNSAKRPCTFWLQPERPRKSSPLGILAASLVLSLTGFPSGGCGGEPAPGKPAPELAGVAGEVNLEFLCQHWVHSREEEQPGDPDQIFRPAAFKVFPPSRFRMSYRFARNGECEAFSLAANDAHQMKAGKWALDPKDKRLLRVTVNGETTQFRIAQLTKDLLRLAPIEALPGR